MKSGTATIGERVRDLVTRLRLDQWVTRQQVSRAIKTALVVIVVPLGVLLILYVISSLFGRTVWELLDLLAVPITIGAAVPLLNWLQKKRELDVEHQRAQDEALQAYLGAMSELMIDHHLRASKPGEGVRTAARLPDQNVEPPDEDVRAVARARTLTALTRLDAGRKRSVLQFLYESGLVKKAQVVVDLRGADLKEADLSLADLSAANLHRADLKEADLSNTDLREANLLRADLRGADLRGADLREGHLIEADLRGANLREAYLNPADLREARLDAAILREAKLSAANLTLADLSAANLLRADLRGADLRGAYLNAADLIEADLREADLRGANLIEANLRGGHLIEADLRGANLSAANLHKADLRGANLHRADLALADLREADLTNATMHNGQKYEEWLKTPEGQQWLITYKEGRREDKEKATLRNGA